MNGHDHHAGSLPCIGCRLLSRLAALAAALALLAPAGGALAAQDEILIGGTLAKSGPLAGAVKPFDDLAQAWAERVNADGGIYLSKLGKKLPVRFKFYDDQTSPPTALKFYERLATVDEVDIFIGPYSSFITNAALQASRTHEIPFFMVESNDEALFEKPNEWRATGLAPAATEYDRTVPLFEGRDDLKTVAILGRENLHERQSMQGAADNFERMGLRVVYKKLAPKGIKDFSSIILAMKQENPDVVLVEALPPPWTIGFLKQARELGLNPSELIVGHVGLPLVKAMGDSGDHIVSFTYYFDGDTPDHEVLYEISREVGVEPWMYPEIGMRYRAFRRIEHALRTAGTVEPEAVRKAMWETELKLFGSEVIRHDERGYGTDIPYPTEIHDGEVISLWPLAQGRREHEPKNGRW